MLTRTLTLSLITRVRPPPLLVLRLKLNRVKRHVFYERVRDRVDRQRRLAVEHDRPPDALGRAEVDHYFLAAPAAFSLSSSGLRSARHVEAVRIEQVLGVRVVVQLRRDVAQHGAAIKKLLGVRRRKLLFHFPRFH